MTNNRLVVRREQAPEVTFSYSFAFSLYQHVVSRSQAEPGTGNSEDGVWADAAARVKALSFQLGPLNFFEFAMVDTDTAADLSREVRKRAIFFADELSEAIGQVEELYRKTVWPEHEVLLRMALEDIRRLFVPVKDVILTRLADRLGMKRQPDSYHAALVPLTYQPTGAYSHPTVISAAHFSGESLVEAVIHEFAHVAAALNDHDPESASALIRKHCVLNGRAPRDAFQLFHLLLFHATGELMREVFSSDYVPYIESRNIYKRMPGSLRQGLPPEKLNAVWSKWTEDHCTLRKPQKTSQTPHTVRH